MEREGQASQRIADGCTLHGGEPFSAICRQCGTYMCRRCNDAARFDTCSSCRAQPVAPARAPDSTHTAGQQPLGQTSATFPFVRDGVAWGAFLRFCFDVYRRNFGLLTLAVLVSLGAVLALSTLGTLLAFTIDDSDLTVLSWFGLFLLQGVLMSTLFLGMLKLCLLLLQNQPAQLSALLGGLPRLGVFLRATFLSAVALLGVELLLALPLSYGSSALDAGPATLGSILLLVLSGLLGLVLMGYVILGLVFASLEIVAHPEVGAVEALKNAWRIAHGERLTLGFGLFLISLLAFAGTMVCGVGGVFTLGYAALIFAALYLALRNGATGLSR